jgi:hypothetical protein
MKADRSDLPCGWIGSLSAETAGQPGSISEIQTSVSPITDLVIHDSVVVLFLVVIVIHSIIVHFKTVTTPVTVTSVSPFLDGSCSSVLSTFKAFGFDTLT